MIENHIPYDLAVIVLAAVFFWYLVHRSEKRRVEREKNAN